MMVNNKSVRKFVAIGIGVLFFNSASTFALDNTVKLGAVMEIQGIYYNNNGKAEQKKLSIHQKQYGFFSTGHIFVDYGLVSDSGMKYGVKLGIEQTTRNNRGTPLSIYVETDYGKIEAGSGKTASQKMKITGYKSSCATGNGWDYYIISFPSNDSDVLVPYVTNFCSFVDSKSRTSRKTDYARSISYFTPKFGPDNHTLQVGVTYIPDTSNVGHGNVDVQSLHTPIKAYDYKFVIRDAVSYGISYEGKFSDLVSAKVAFVGETGKPIAFNNADSSKSDKKFKDLNTYIIGSEITYDQFSVSASYMNYNKSLTNSDIDTRGRDTSIYTAGMKYNFGEKKYAASINHFHSENKKNKLDATSVGLDYLIASGLKTYIQGVYYQTNGAFDEAGVIKKNKSNGTIAIIGAVFNL